MQIWLFRKIFRETDSTKTGVRLRYDVIKTLVRDVITLT
jgi:hypothetical protein